MKYPIGIQSFENIIEDGFVYVDKTDLVYSLATEGKVYFLSRPRKFGKSLLVSTLKCYFEGRKELFKGLAIDSLETDWYHYPVFHLSFGGQNFPEPYTLDKVLDEFVSEAESIYGKGPFAQTLSSRFKAVLGNAHKKTGKRAVVLIDEYDKPLLDVMDAEMTITTDYGKIGLEEYNRNLLKGFYSVFKEADADLRFVFLTGVTKFSQVSVFSGFNQPDDISLSPEYETLCGITEEEMLSVFAEPIEKMSKSYGCDYDGMVAMLKKQYDGYHFSKEMTEIYNPFSLLNALKKGDIQNYWFRTGTPTYLIRLMEHFSENLYELTGRYMPNRTSLTTKPTWSVLCR